MPRSGTVLRWLDEFAEIFEGTEVFVPNLLLYLCFMGAYYAVTGAGPSRLTRIEAVPAVFAFDLICDLWLFIRDRAEVAGSDEVGTA